MEQIVREERRRIFRQELYTLEKEGYLSEDIVSTVAKAHHQFHLDLIHQEDVKTASPKITQEVKQIKPVSVKPQKVKKSLTPEEIRERNITWSLNIGVIFLLIGGLFVATSNWQSMTGFMKSGLIAIVALLFYALAYLTKKVLHIDKTALAFIVLGSLFLPIFILSLGWFGLLGTYFSINGDGRFFVGALGSLMPIVVYVWFAKNLGSRLFVWFTYVSFSAGAAFFLAGLNFNIDYFYLGHMLFNVILIFLYHLTKKRQSLLLFTKEFVPFVQANLILSTLFMLFLYDNHLTYSFTLFLTAIVYLSMIFVSGKKEYHFVFSIMLVYAAYQFFEHSALKSFSAIGYALVGFGIVFVPRLLKGEFSLDKAFHYTSAVISGFAFIYISFEGMLLRAGTPSAVLMIAYFVVAANFIYLSKQVGLRLFSYLSSVFLASAIYEGTALTFHSLNMIHFPFTLFIAGFLLSIIFGSSLISKYLKTIQTGSRDIGISIMGIALLSGLAFSYWWELGLMLLLLMFASYLIYVTESRLMLNIMALWTLPSALGLSLTAFGEEFNSRYLAYNDQFGNGVNFAAGAIVVLLSSFVWKKAKKYDLSRVSLYMSQVLYSISIGYSLISPINLVWIQPLLLTIGIGMYSFLYSQIKTKWVPILISTTVLLSYYSIVHSISMNIEFSRTVDSFIASISAVLVLFIGYLYLKKDSAIANGFAWTGHIIYPFALFFTLFAYHAESSFVFIIAVFVYGISVMLTKAEWKVKVFLYASFTALLFVVSTFIDNIESLNFGNYEFPITSVMISIFYLLTSHTFRKRTSYYLVPFSLLGILSVLLTYPFGVLPFLITIVYTGGVLFYLHKINLSILAILPLFFTFLATIEFSFYTGLSETGKLLLTGGIGVLSVLIGIFIYKDLIRGREIKNFKIDAYTATAFLYFLFMYYFRSEHVWTHILPGILISAAILMQTKRVPARYSVFITIFGAVYLLQPYYSMIQELKIPALWEKEAICLPWIVLVIFIRFKLKSKYTSVTKSLEWGILLIVSAVLIQDGLSSSTIYDAIILGSLSLISMLVGMLLQIKSYFFVGSGVLLLNVFLQTRPYWGHMPWWGYLLIVGFILITVASFNEWNKQKILKGETTFITILKNHTIDKIKKWE